MPPERHDAEGIDRLRGAMYSRKYGQEIGPRPRHELDTEEPKVAEDWKHEEMQEPDGRPIPNILKPQRSRVIPMVKWLVGLSILFFIGATSFFIYYLYFGGASGISARNIDISVTGPAQIAGGEHVQRQETVTNRNRDTLQKADLVATFPAGTRLDPSSCSESSCRVTLGTIAPGATLPVKLPAIYQGTAGAHAQVEIALEYQLDRSNATFSASTEDGFVFS